mgnify:CR=1 FL=1
MTTPPPSLLADLFDPQESDDVVRRVAKLYDMRETRKYFAEDCHVNSHGEPMDFSKFPHIRELYNTVDPVIVLQGSVQSFKTEWGIIDHFSAAYCGLAVFFVLPKFEMRNTFVQNRVDRCIQEVDTYKQLVGSASFDNMAMKGFGKGVIKYVGSNVLADFREFPADIIYVEEVDDCSMENIKYAVDRTRASHYQFRRYLGNPKIAGEGINKYFQESDQREWYVPCTQCGEHSPMDSFPTLAKALHDRHGNVINYRLSDEEWEVGCGRDIYCKCPKCGDGNLDRSSQDGKWVRENPESNITGYHFSMLCSLINTVAGMWDRFKEALNDPTSLQHFFNSDLGLPFSPEGNKITSAVLDRCVEKDYNLVIHPDRAFIQDDCHPGPCSMGIDVGANFDVRISYLEPRGVRRMVFVGKLRSLDEAHELIDRYHVEKCVIDSMPETTLAHDFQFSASCDVWTCRYHVKEGGDQKISYDGINRRVLVDRTALLDRSYAAIRGKKSIFPENYSSICKGQFTEEMTGPVRQLVKDAKGNPRYEWTKCRDHQRHADGYDFLAAQMMMDATIDTIHVG